MPYLSGRLTHRHRQGGVDPQHRAGRDRGFVFGRHVGPTDLQPLDPRIQIADPTGHESACRGSPDVDRHTRNILRRTPLCSACTSGNLPDASRRPLGEGHVPRRADAHSRVQAQRNGCSGSCLEQLTTQGRIDFGYVQHQRHGQNLRRICRVLGSAVPTSELGVARVERVVR